MRSIFFILILGTILSAKPVMAEPQTVHIGVLAIWGENTARKMWQPTIDYLNQQIPNKQFQLVPLSLASSQKLTRERAIDFIITNPGNYVSLEASYDVTRILTLRSRRQGHITTRFAGVIFTRADRDNIKSLADLKNKSFMGVKDSAFGGFQMAWYELKKAGLDPYNDFSSLSFSGFPQDNIVYAVRDAKVDAGTVRTDTLERMAKEGHIKLSDFHIINEHAHQDVPFKHSTAHYPEWPLAKLSHISEQLAKQLTIALLSIEENSHVAKAARSAGWTVPLDYSPVHNLMKELQVGPYKPDPAKKSQIQKLKTNFWMVLAILIISIPFALIYITKLRIRVQEDEEKLEQIENEWSHALDFLDEPMYMVDLDDRLIRANKAFFKKIGHTAEQALGKKVTLFTHPEGEEIPCKVCQARKDLNDTTIILEADDPANKMAVPMEISLKVIRNLNNEAIGIVQGMRDLTQSRASEIAIRQSEALFRGLLNTTPDPLVAINSHGLITIVNSQFEKQFGYSRNEIIGHEIEVLVPDRFKHNHKHLRSVFHQDPKLRPMGYNLELSGLHKDGREIPLEISLSPFEVENETLVIAALHDISKRKKNEHELKRLASFPELDPMPIVEYSLKENKVTYLNFAAQQHFPDLEELSDKHPLLENIELLTNDLKSNENQLIRDIEFNQTFYEQNINLDTESQLIRIYSWDITKLREMSKRMSYHATHDSLTTLTNRREFENQLERAIMTANIEGKHHAVCYMDLDQFKVVNDTCGHVAGDELLKQLASVLKTHIRDSDTLARLGGDEFGLLLIGCDVKVAEQIAEKIRKEVEAFRFHWDGKTFKIGASMGLVPIKKDSGALSDILSAADTACYVAKDNGRNQIYTYRINDALSEKHTNEMNWIHRIHDALENDYFVLYVQEISPALSAMDSRYEVLIRMKTTDNKIIPPMAFLTAAERYNMITDIDLWVIRNTLEKFSQTEMLQYYFSINLSGQTLSNSRVMSRIVQYINDSHVNPERICFEVTETAMIANLNSAIRFINTLRGLGCTMALDDFGSGLSSFAYLKNLPVNYLKIDGDFVRNMDTDTINAAMVESIIQVGHKMGLEIIAEYVENNYILEQLKNMGANYVQGYAIARPQPIENLATISTSVANLN